MASKASIMSAASDLQMTVGRLVRRLRSENAFPISQAIVLSRLAREGPSTASALAAAELVRPQSMAQTIADLEASGLVERRRDPLDRRQTLVVITNAGQETLARDRLRREGWLATAITKTLTAEEQAILAQAIPLLGRIAES